MRIEGKFYRGESGDTKTPRSHRVVTLGMLAGAYRKQVFGLRSDEYVFTNSEGHPLDYRNVLKQVKRVAKRFGA